MTATIVIPSPFRRSEERDDLLTRRRVQLSCGLVGEEEARLVGQCAGDGNPLLLTAGKLRRTVPGPVGQPHVGQQLAGACTTLPLPHPRLRHRQLHILRRGQHREQVEALKDEADVLQAQAGSFCFP